VKGRIAADIYARRPDILVTGNCRRPAPRAAVSYDKFKLIWFYRNYWSILHFCGNVPQQPNWGTAYIKCSTTYKYLNKELEVTNSTKITDTACASTNMTQVYSKWHVLSTINYALFGQCERQSVLEKNLLIYNSNSPVYYSHLQYITDFLRIPTFRVTSESLSPLHHTYNLMNLEGSLLFWLKLRSPQFYHSSQNTVQLIGKQRCNTRTLRCAVVCSYIVVSVIWPSTSVRSGTTRYGRNCWCYLANRCTAKWSRD